MFLELAPFDSPSTISTLFCLSYYCNGENLKRKSVHNSTFVAQWSSILSITVFLWECAPGHTDLNPYIPDLGRISREYLSPLLAVVEWALPPLLWRRVCLLEETKGKREVLCTVGGALIFIYKAEQVNLGPPREFSGTDC